MAIGLPVTRAYPFAMATAISSWVQRMISGPPSPKFTSESWSPRYDAPGFNAM